MKLFKSKGEVTLKKFKLVLASMAMTLLMSTTAFAGQWMQDTTGWWYQNNDGSYLKSGWYWINGASYLFNDNGYIYQNTTTPDGYAVNADGAWTQDGVVQTRSTESTVANITVSIPNGYDASTDVENGSVALTETNGSSGALAMVVHEPAIQDIRASYGEDGIKRVSDEVANGLIEEVGSNPVLVGQDSKQYTNGSWYHYVYNVSNETNTQQMECNMYISLLEQDARIVIILNKNREFTEDQFMMYYIK